MVWSFSGRMSPPAPRAVILVVDDNPSMRETARAILRRLDLDVREADSGAAAVAAIRRQQFDLALIDFVLPDISGLDVIVELKRQGVSVPWLLMSGWITTPVAVEAMRLGAIDVVDLPFDIERVVTSALRDRPPREAIRWPSLPDPAQLRAPRSAAERWALLVLRGCAADHDLKTIGDWATAAGISYSALTESCRLVGIRPHHARDFLRMLRLLFQSNGRLKDLEHGLDVNDHRTLKALFARAGLAGRRDDAAIPLREFLAVQQFVDPTCDAVRLMVEMVEPGDNLQPQAVPSAKLPSKFPA
jgi:DNA-binding response OmpR family regulator